jgi:Zn-dependent protease with chaperone function
MLSATYFDGVSSRAQTVQLQVANHTLTLYRPAAQAEDTLQIVRQAALSELRVSERLRHAPRLVTFPDGAHLEVRDGAAFTALLAQTGFNESPVTRWQQSWKATLIAFVVTLIALAAGYRWVLPAVSHGLALQIPPEWTTPISEHTLSVLDKEYMTPSALPAERQQALSHALQALVASEEDLPPLKLVFRQSPKIGPNAFALPDGTIVLTDELVALAQQDVEVLAVLAHEAGHVKHRHGLRLAIQSSFVGFVIGWYLGDVSSVITGVSAALLESRYSRDFEYQADEYGGALLSKHQRSPMLLANMLAKLEQAAADKAKRGHKDDKKGEQGPANNQPKPDASTEEDSRAAQIGELFSSHPETQARIERLKQQAEGL